jgi:hypothetical protein
MPYLIFHFFIIYIGGGKRKRLGLDMSKGLFCIDKKMVDRSQPSSLSGRQSLKQSLWLAVIINKPSHSCYAQ